MRRLAATLSPIAAIAVGRRADEDEAGSRDGLGEVGVLGEEAVAGVNRLGAGRSGGVEDRGDIEVALGRGRRADAVRLVGQPHVQRVAVGLGIDRDRADAQLAAGGGDADGDLAPVGDQDRGERPASRSGGPADAARAFTRSALR